MSPAKLSDKAADVLFGTTPEVGLGELQGLVRRIIAALDAPHVGLRIAGVGALIAAPFEAPVEPVLEWDAPAPVWEAQDYSVPTA